VLGLGQSLADAGKNCQMVLQDAIPAKFHFLEGSDKIKHAIDPVTTSSSL
jgi:hypothetical protein